MTRPTTTGALILALAAVAAGPAAADWLVMSDGTRVETDGAWTERGKLVVFTDASGNFVSLRRADVDLEASRQATQEAREAADRPSVPPAPAPRRPSVMRLTDEDVAHVDEPLAAPAPDPGADESGETTEAEAPRPQSLVEVAAWERDNTPAGDGLLVRATLENPSGDAAVGITVNVTLYDDEGEILATAPGRLAASGLMPGQRTDAVATFPGVFDFAAVDFDIDHRALAARPAEATPSGEEDLVIDQDLEDFGESG